MLQALFAVLTKSFGKVQFSLRDTLVNPDSMILHPTGTIARRAESKLLRPLADFQFRSRTQPVASPQRFRKNHASEFVQFELHMGIMPYYFGNGNMNW